ncbi:MAG TPA: hypothetical protein DCY51_10120 [Bacteroidetes bacterium]|nr:hypothetical protein [Bacteroidota bacterium]
MKKITPSLLIFLVTCLFVSSAYCIEKRPKEKKPKNHYSMKDGEVVPFGDEVVGVIKTISSRGAYDGSRYRWSADNGIMAIHYVSAANGQHQSELEISHGIGEVLRKGDTSVIQSKSIYKKFYIFNVADNYVVDSFSKKIHVSIVTRSLTESESSLLISNHNSSLRTIALPHGVKTKQIWKAEHPKETVAEFAHLTISDSDGEKVNYPAGDYVLVGADKLLL